MDGAPLRQTQNATFDTCPLFWFSGSAVQLIIKTDNNNIQTRCVSVHSAIWLFLSGISRSVSMPLQAGSRSDSQSHRGSVDTVSVDSGLVGSPRELTNGSDEEEMSLTERELEVSGTHLKKHTLSLLPTLPISLYIFYLLSIFLLNLCFEVLPHVLLVKIIAFLSGLQEVFCQLPFLGCCFFQTDLLLLLRLLLFIFLFLSCLPENQAFFLQSCLPSRPCSHLS